MTTSGAAADLYSPAYFDNPYPALASLRSTEPVCWSERAGAFVVTRYDDCVAILTDARRIVGSA